MNVLCTTSRAVSNGHQSGIHQSGHGRTRGVNVSAVESVRVISARKSIIDSIDCVDGTNKDGTETDWFGTSTVESTLISRSVGGSRPLLNCRSGVAIWRVTSSCFVL